MYHYQRRFIAAVSLCVAAVPNLVFAVAVSGQGTWETTLQGRDLDGNLATFEAYYDTALNITWLADDNYAGIHMTWANARTWAASLNPYGRGITGWRLPTVTDTGTSGCNLANSNTDCGYNVDITTGEMAHMFHSTLGNLSRKSPSGEERSSWGLINTGPFSNLQDFLYWSATEYAPNTNYAWNFSFYEGVQSYSSKGIINYNAWAVHAGDVGASAVPVPAAAWLFGSGLLGLVGMSRKRRR